MRDASVKSYSPAYELNKPVTNSATGVVVKSGAQNFKEGDSAVSYTHLTLPTKRIV